MRLTAIYGGAFDPVHEGHLAVACQARDRLDARVVLIPTGDPRHRPAAHASGAQRLAMLELALHGARGLSVDARELHRHGASYTVDTLTQLRAELGPDAPLAMIVGEDAFAGLPGWHRWQDLFALAHVVVASRPQPVSVPDLLAETVSARIVLSANELHAQAAGKVFYLALPPHRQSSSLIRARCAANLPLDGWVPPAVADYIRAHALYRRS